MDIEFMKLLQRIFHVMAIISLQKAAEAVLCFDCHSELGTCNDGECEGTVCVKMETSNRDNERRTVQKGCSEEYEESGCQQSAFGSKWTSRCVCDRTMCNGDAALIAAGLETSSGTVGTTSIPGAQLALLSFVFIFVAASCSLLIINTAHLGRKLRTETEDVTISLNKPNYLT